MIATSQPAVQHLEAATEAAEPVPITMRSNVFVRGLLLLCSPFENIHSACSCDFSGVLENFLKRHTPKLKAFFYRQNNRIVVLSFEPFCDHLGRTEEKHVVAKDLPDFRGGFQTLCARSW